MASRTLANSRVVLTGASSGIGRELARVLAQRGARLVLSARRADRLSELTRELALPPERISTVVGDVTDPAVQTTLLRTAQEQWGGLDGLINNAGMGGIGEFERSSSDRLRRIMEVNFFAPLELIRAALPLLRQGTNPFILNVASVLGHCAVPKKSEYCASKFALHGFTDALRDELSPAIDVLLFCPSTTATEFFDVAPGDRRELKWAVAGQDAREVAAAAVRAMERGSRETILTVGGRGLVWLDRLLPSLAHWLIRKNA
jgi:short-subunit dehydrogenase